MKCLSTQLANSLAACVHDHAEAYPNGDWKAVNNRISTLRLLADQILPVKTADGVSIYRGNAETISALRKIGGVA